MRCWRAFRQTVNKGAASFYEGVATHEGRLYSIEGSEGGISDYFERRGLQRDGVLIFAQNDARVQRHATLAFGKEPQWVDVQLLDLRKVHQQLRDA